MKYICLGYIEPTSSKCEPGKKPIGADTKDTTSVMTKTQSGTDVIHDIARNSRTAKRRNAEMPT